MGSSVQSNMQHCTIRPGQMRLLIYHVTLRSTCRPAVLFSFCTQQVQRLYWILLAYYFIWSRLVSTFLRLTLSDLTKSTHSKSPFSGYLLLIHLVRSIRSHAWIRLCSAWFSSREWRWSILPCWRAGWSHWEGWHVWGWLVACMCYKLCIFGQIMTVLTGP